MSEARKKAEEIAEEATRIFSLSGSDVPWLTEAIEKALAEKDAELEMWRKNQPDVAEAVSALKIAEAELAYFHNFEIPEDGVFKTIAQLTQRLLRYEEVLKGIACVSQGWKKGFQCNEADIVMAQKAITEGGAQ